MGLNSWIRDRIAGLVEFGGTVSTPTADDINPSHIANEGAGGLHSYLTLEDLADMPKARMVRGMQVNVLRHVRPDDTIFERQSFILEPASNIWESFDEDPGLEKISDIDGYDLSLFWKPAVQKSGTTDTQEIQSQYADAQDYGRIGDPATPAFLAPLISKENYQAGRKSDADSSIIWSDDYDPSIHKYERQRLGDLGQWGIPKLINATSYSQGDYVDNRFIWIEKGEVPARPPSLVNGQSNGEPAGWQNTPAVPDDGDYYEYIQENDLYRISASKDTYGILKSEWSTPIKISTDPNLVRYGNKPSSTNFIAEGGGDTEDWRGYYTPGTDTHMAVRENEDAAWRIQNIDNEEGEYVDLIFKAFPLGYEPNEDDRPTISNPFSELIDDYPNNDWKDYPFQVEDDEVLYRSVGRKYNNGQLKPSGWSIPTRNDGQDTIQVVVEPQTADNFKYKGDGTVTPAVIVLHANLYRGKELVDPDIDIKWYKGDVASENQIIEGSSVGASAYHEISGSNNQILTISPDAVDGVQKYTAVAILSGEDYVSTFTVLDVTDGIGIIADIDSDSGYTFKNGDGEIEFTANLFVNGVLVDDSDYTVEWILGTTPIGTDHTVVVSGEDIDGKEVLRLVATYDGTEYTRSVTLTDVHDGEAPLTEYSSQNPLPASPGAQVWTSDPTGAYYMRWSNDGGETWTILRVRGENAPYNGGFQRSAYKNASSKPTASGLTSGLLPTGSGWTAAPTDPGVGEATWEVTAFFTKNVGTSDTSLTSANWNIDGSWSTAIRKTGIDGSAEGPQGDDGPVGWSPVIANVVVSSTRVVQRVTDWINLGGADPGTKPATGSYLSPTGFTPDISAATNIRGPQGDDANSRPMYYVNIGTKQLSPPTTNLNAQGTMTYLGVPALEVKNNWTQTRYFRVDGEIPVSNDRGNDSWTGFLYMSSTSSFPASAVSATRVDQCYSRMDYVNAGVYPSVHKIRVQFVVSVPAGQSRYFRLGVMQSDGTASQIGYGYIEAFGI